MTGTTVRLKRSSSSGGVPSVSDLALGELAVNTHDGKLFLKKDDGTASIVEIGTGGGGGGPSTATKVFLYDKANTGNADSFDGSETRFQLRDENGAIITDISSAYQLLISVDGVIQESNSSSSGTDGFYIADNNASGKDIVFLAAPASSSEFFGTAGIPSASFATVAISGSYSDLTNTPTTVSSVAGKTGTVTLVKADVGLGNVDNTADSAKPISTAAQTALNAKADLVGGKLNTSQIPDLAVTEYLGSAANQAAMLAFTGQKGDWCNRADTGQMFIISGTNPSQLSSWAAISYPASPVVSVAGKTGAVTLTHGDIGSGAVTASTGAFSGNVDIGGAVAGLYKTGALIQSNGKLASYVQNSTTASDQRIYVYNGDLSGYTATINADGSASFGSGTVTLAANTGVTINDGAIDLYQATSNTSAKPFKVSSDVGGTDTEVAFIQASGSASFASITAASTITSGGDPNAGANRGTSINQYGTFRAAQTSGTVFEGYTVNTTAPTSTISAAGSAYFAGSVLVGTATSNSARFKVSDDGAHEFAFFPNDAGVNSLVNYNRSGAAYVDMSIAAKEVLFKTGTSPTNRLLIDGSGRLIVGRTSSVTSGSAADSVVQIVGKKSSPTDLGQLTIARGNSASNLTTGAEIGEIIFSDNAGNNFAQIQCKTDGATGGVNGNPGSLRFYTEQAGSDGGPVQRMQIDSSGRVLINSSTVQAHPNMDDLQLGDGTGNRGLTISSGTSGYGTLAFGDSADGSGNDRYSGSIEYYHSDNSMRFYTNIGERMRVRSDGTFLVGQTQDSFGVVGHIFNKDGRAFHIANSNPPLWLNRHGSDGHLVRFYNDDTQVGDIHVNGTLVTFNGAHLTRWSQLAGNGERIEILRGTVLSNLDEMCEWSHAAQDAVLYTEEDAIPEGFKVGDVKTPAVEAYTEDNEQLNRMKISDVEGDKNVAGVFESWDDEDDTFTGDFYCSMNGDHVIRIGKDVTVARGDLLMSAGDGTAKPQDDDIVRSKTVAKVTSTTVSETYSDGSYCVPCVLMAC